LKKSATAPQPTAATRACCGQITSGTLSEDEAEGFLKSFF
jgi:hypothetical protein